MHTDIYIYIHTQFSNRGASKNAESRPGSQAHLGEGVGLRGVVGTSWSGYGKLHISYVPLYSILFI